MSIPLLKQTRQNFTRLVAPLTLAQLNQIPAGFNNNIFWNFAHSVVSAELLCLKLANSPCTIDERVITQFRKGTKPERAVEQEEVQQLLAWAESSLANLENVYEKGLLQNYTSYETSYGFTLHSIEDALSFCCAHEALHLGYAMAQKRLVVID